MGVQDSPNLLVQVDFEVFGHVQGILQCLICVNRSSSALFIHTFFRRFFLFFFLPFLCTISIACELSLSLWLQSLCVRIIDIDIIIISVQHFVENFVSQNEFGTWYTNGVKSV